MPQSLTTVLFDLDGTLLPMQQEPFIKLYFGLLAKACVPLGLAKEKLLPAVWAGTEAMVKNDGAVLNHDRFWDTFAAAMGEHVRALEPAFDRFYGGEFHGAKAATQPTPLAAECVALLKAKGYRLILATNPLFPLVGVESRMAWAGLNPADFERITHYGNSRYCKPNPAYYREIFELTGADPRESLMVGNDVREDLCVAQLGCGTYLVTDCLEHGEDVPAAPIQGALSLRGSMGDFRDWAASLPDCR